MMLFALRRGPQGLEEELNPMPTLIEYGCSDRSPVTDEACLHRLGKSASDWQSNNLNTQGHWLFLLLNSFSINRISSSTDAPKRFSSSLIGLVTLANCSETIEYLTASINLYKKRKIKVQSDPWKFLITVLWQIWQCAYSILVLYCRVLDDWLIRAPRRTARDVDRIPSASCSSRALDRSIVVSRRRLRRFSVRRGLFWKKRVCPGQRKEVL